MLGPDWESKAFLRLRELAALKKALVATKQSFLWRAQLSPLYRAPRKGGYRLRCAQEGASLAATHEQAHLLFFEIGQFPHVAGPTACQTGLALRVLMKCPFAARSLRQRRSAECLPARSATCRADESLQSSITLP
eukprot:GILK01027036.1.p2 GENE.GILK01027036.1~~GILK01027036.1.p2  ORF type:complete len:135 (-),score=9.39 GILK01027036.1:390-794(-)